MPDFKDVQNVEKDCHNALDAMALLGEPNVAMTKAICYAILAVGVRVDYALTRLK